MALARSGSQPPKGKIPLFNGQALQWFNPAYDITQPMRDARLNMSEDAYAITVCMQGQSHFRDYLPTENGYFYLRHGHAPLERAQWDAHGAGFGSWLTATLMARHIKSLLGYFAAQPHHQIPGARAIILRKISIVAIYDEPWRAFLLLDPEVPGHDQMAEPERLSEDFPKLFENRIDPPLVMDLSRSRS